MLRKIIFIAALFIATVLLMALQKPLFLLWYAPLAADASASELLAVSWHGLMLDSTTAGYVCVVPLLVMIATVWIPLSERTVRRVLNIYFAVISVAVAVIVAVDLALYKYWGFRLDDTILLYLKTPEEAAASITWSDVWPQMIVITVYTALMVFVYRRLITLYTNDSLTLWRRIGST
ncbi:MAG TPA: LTA synthase family protein, partial [Candidatus Alistipes merdipullorum]|nr:LTA synthase family protein [Candidatus Alistipes merdipullorum]